jgi:hypothetical protein
MNLSARSSRDGGTEFLARVSDIGDERKRIKRAPAVKIPPEGKFE